MPGSKFKKGYKRGYKRKYYKRRNYKKRASTTTNRMPVIPDRMFTKLKYHERVTMTSTLGATEKYNFVGNGMYDPNNTGIGGQPIGYDQWTAFYDRYRVYKCDISVQVVPSDVTTPMDVCVFPGTLPSGYNTIDDAIEAPYARYNMVIGYDMIRSRIRNSMMTGKILGISKNATTSDDLVAGFASTNPSRSWYFTIYTAPVDRASTKTLIVDVTLTFYCEFFDRTELNRS